MESCEFLLQKKGTRSWLPIKHRKLKLEAGIYRIVAQSCRANTEVEIRLLHQTFDTPPKRRSHQRDCRTTRDGLMVVVPYTYFKSGYWEIRARSEQDGAEPWQAVIQMQVLPPKMPEAPTPESEQPTLETTLSAPQQAQPAPLPPENVVSSPLPPRRPPQPVKAQPAAPKPQPETPRETALDDPPLIPPPPRPRELARFAPVAPPPEVENAPPKKTLDSPPPPEPEPLTAHSLLEQSIFSLEQILEQVAEPPPPEAESAPEVEISPEYPSEEPEVAPPEPPPNLDLTITLLQDTFIRRNREPILISGHVNFNNPNNPSPLDQGFGGRLRYELRDPQGGELLLDVEQPLSDATIPLVFNYLLDIPSSYNTRLILGQVILEVEPQDGENPPERGQLLPLASQTFSITAGLNELMTAVQTIPSAPGMAGALLDEEERNLEIKLDFLNLTAKPPEPTPLEPKSGPALPPLLRTAGKPQKPKPKSLQLPNFSSPPPKSLFGQSSNFLSLPASPEQRSEVEDEEERDDDLLESLSLPPSLKRPKAAPSPEEGESLTPLITPPPDLEDSEKPIDEEQAQGEETDLTLDISSEYVTDAPENLLEEVSEEKKVVDQAFQSLRLKDRFWQHVSSLAEEEDVDEELATWLQTQPPTLENPTLPLSTEEEAADLDTTTQRLAQKAEVTEEVAAEIRQREAENLVLDDVTFFEKMNSEAELLQHLAAETQGQHFPTPEDQVSPLLAQPEVETAWLQQEIVVDEEEEDSFSPSLPSVKHDTSGLPYPAELQSVQWRQQQGLISQAESGALAGADLPELERSEEEDNPVVPMAHPLLQVNQPFGDTSLREVVPTPRLEIPPGELTAGELVLVRVKLPARVGSVYVKLWVQDLETRQLLDGPRAFVDFERNGAGELETMTQLIIPLGSLAIRFEAIAIDVATQRESHKAIADRAVIPPDFHRNEIVTSSRR